MSEKQVKTLNLKIRDGAVQTSDHFTTRWSAVLPAEHDFDEVKNPAYWSIPAKRMRTDDIVEIRSEDQRFYAEAYILKATPQGVVMKIMRYEDLQNEKPAELADGDLYEYAYKGPQWKHCVIRKSDGEPMAKGLNSKADALQWIAVHTKNAA